jgi:hypothetical protein
LKRSSDGDYISTNEGLRANGHRATDSNRASGGLTVQAKTTSNHGDVSLDRSAVLNGDFATDNNQVTLQRLAAFQDEVMADDDLTIQSAIAGVSRARRQQYESQQDE